MSNHHTTNSNRDDLAGWQAYLSADDAPAVSFDMASLVCAEFGWTLNEPVDQESGTWLVTILPEHADTLAEVGYLALDNDGIAAEIETP